NNKRDIQNLKNLNKMNPIMIKSNGHPKNTIIRQVLLPTQAWNAFTVEIIRQIQAKLEGKDFESITQMTVQEQIDKIIQQSFDIDNLYVMY
ncbi:10019_t:CDS:2, partial [Gigaspora rosea]